MATNSDNMENTSSVQLILNHPVALLERMVVIERLAVVDMKSTSSLPHGAHRALEMLARSGTSNGPWRSAPTTSGIMFCAAPRPNTAPSSRRSSMARGQHRAAQTASHAAKCCGTRQLLACPRRPAHAGLATNPLAAASGCHAPAFAVQVTVIAAGSDRVCESRAGPVTRHPRARFPRSP